MGIVFGVQQWFLLQYYPAAVTCYFPTSRFFPHSLNFLTWKELTPGAGVKHSTADTESDTALPIRKKKKTKWKKKTKRKKQNKSKQKQKLKTSKPEPSPSPGGQNRQHDSTPTLNNNNEQTHTEWGLYIDRTPGETSLTNETQVTVIRGDGQERPRHTTWTETTLIVWIRWRF